MNGYASYRKDVQVTIIWVNRASIQCENCSEENETSYNPVTVTSYAYVFHFYPSPITQKSYSC